MIALDNVYWLRNRHRELDTFRTLDINYNIGWYLFFGTVPPGLNNRVLKNAGRIVAGSVQRAIRTAE